MAGKKKKPDSVGTENADAAAVVSVPAKKRRGRPKGSKNKTPSKKTGGKRGRKAIFSDEQKKVLDRMIRISLKSELRALVKAL